MNSSGVVPALRVSAAARLERLPLTAYHYRLFGIIALAFFFDSIDLATMTFVLGSIQREFSLSAARAGVVASASFAGMVLGACAAGVLADRWGRRPIFQVSMLLWGVASYLCSLVHSVPQLLAARVLLGIGMGMEFPIAQTLLAEFVPTRARGRLVALLDGAWPLGFIVSGVLSYVLLPRYGWRTEFALLALPALAVLLVRSVVPESPRWLEHRSRLRAADGLLDRIEVKVMRSAGVTHLPPPAALAAPLQRSGGLAQIWSAGYARRTLMLWLLWFFALLGFYGLTSWLAALLQMAGYAVTKSVLYTVWISLAGLPGFVCAAWLVERWGRKPTCIATLLGAAASAYLYGQAARELGSVALLIGSGLAMQFCLFGMWAVLYTYTPELYDTGARATGSGVASAVGRVGSLIGPSVVGVIVPLFGSAGVFSLGALCFVLAALAVGTLGIETRGVTLEALAAPQSAG